MSERKDMTGESEFFWVGAGADAFILFGDGGIKAVLYWSPEEPVTLDGPDDQTGHGEPYVMESDWSLVFADAPQDHEGLGVESRGAKDEALSLAEIAVKNRDES